MRGFRFVLLGLICCLSFAAAPSFAGQPTALPVTFTLITAPASSEILPPDPFLDGIVTTSVSAVCTLCNPMIQDSCVPFQNGAPCQNNPACKCRKCNGVQDCFRI